MNPITAACQHLAAVAADYRRTTGSVPPFSRCWRRRGWCISRPHHRADPGSPAAFPPPRKSRAGRDPSPAGGSNVGFGYGSLAAGADILFAEALLARGASLHVVLPFDRRRICRGVGAAVGPTAGWPVQSLPRNGPPTVRYATADHYLGDDHLFGYCSQLAMGLALLRGAPSVGRGRADRRLGRQPARRAGRHRGRCRALAADRATRSTSFRSARLRAGRRAASRRERALRRRTRAMLFGDIHGFSKLTDAQLPHFHRRDARRRRASDRAPPRRSAAGQYLGRRAVPGVRRRRQGGQLRARAAGGA